MKTRTEIRCNNDKSIKAVFIPNGGDINQVLVYIDSDDEYWFSVGQTYKSLKNAKKAAVKACAKMGYTFDEKEMNDLEWKERTEPKTYKVTFFTKELEVENVITYHDITDQGYLLDTIAINIHTLELAEVVKCETEDENYTAAVNEMIKVRLANLAA